MQPQDKFLNHSKEERLVEKLITFAVPCYNSAAYMRHCIDSLLTAGEDAEIIIVNDGSTDNTAQIADEYAERYPQLVRAVHKQNGGHGSGVNKGLELANGMYYKVVDSDDWLDADALQKLLEVMREHREKGVMPDLYISNYVYEKVYENKRVVRRYTKNMPVNTFFGWNRVKPFRTSNVLLMHSLLYRTDLLRKSGTVLPEKTFYVDNIYAYKPLPYMQTMYYMDIDLYRYFIGRNDQSVNAQNIVKRYEQQIRVMKEMIAAYSYEELAALPRGLFRYMKHDIGVIMTLTVMFTTGGTDEQEKRKAALRDLWDGIKRADPKMYRYLRYQAYPSLVNWMPFRLQGKVTVMGYKFFRRKLCCS